MQQQQQQQQQQQTTATTTTNNNNQQQLHFRTSEVLNNRIEQSASDRPFHQQFVQR